MCTQKFYISIFSIIFMIFIILWLYNHFSPRSKVNIHPYTILWNTEQFFSTLCNACYECKQKKCWCTYGLINKQFTVGTCICILFLPEMSKYITNELTNFYTIYWHTDLPTVSSFDFLTINEGLRMLLFLLTLVFFSVSL